ncbi:hypothetical protein KAU55_05880 [Candidatus Bathyarchaeota archaeon]|nr:hypothetical protein [Candidatus Bathyarchaeota archaeon]
MRNEVKALKEKIPHGFLEGFEGATSAVLKEESGEEDKLNQEHSIYEKEGL